jgi:hypothetical protein
MSELNFIDYDKITIQSDAFVTSEELNCYLQYLPSTKALSYNIKKDKHTAGTTNDPDDYKIPDIRQKLSPKKLYRINPFHKNNAEYLELHKTNIDPEIIFPTETKEVKIVENDYSDMGLNEDQIEFLLALKNLKTLKVDDISKKLDLEQFAITDEKMLEGFFQVYPRYMESLVASSGLQETISYEEEPEESMSYNQDSSAMDYHLKKMGLNPSEITVKKNFQVRTGNAKSNQINSFLQEKKVENNFDTKLSTVNNTENLNSLSISNKNNQKYINKISTSTFTNNQNFNALVQNINQTKNVAVSQNIRIRKNVAQEQVDFQNIFKSLLKDLSLKNNITNLYNREINLQSRNTSFEFISQINQSFSKEYNTNIRNQTSAYNFYRHIENRYREFVQNLNFFHETLQEFKKTEYKIRNSYQNVHQHNFTQKNQYNKNVINVTKEINFETNMLDYTFQSAILKTVEKTNSITQNNIEKIKESLNYVQHNVSYVDRKVSYIQYKTENKIAKEVRNVLNNQEFSDEYSNIIVTKISNIANNTEVKKLLSIVKNEEILQNLSYVVKQAGMSVDNIKSITEIINLSKNVNFNISKISNESVQNVKNLLSLSESFFKNYNIANLSNNITENFKELVNISQSKEFVLLSKSFKNISPVMKYISENNILNQNTQSYNNQITYTKNKNFRTSVDSNVVQISNTIKQVSNINEIAKVTNELSNINNISEISNSILKLSEVKDVKIFEQLNLFTEPKITKSFKVLKRISQIKNINNIEDYQQNISLVNQNLVDKKDVEVKTSNINQINKFINLIENSNLNSTQITALNKLSNQNIQNAVNVINNISKNENNVNKISQIVNEVLNTDVNKVYKLSNINNNQISNINLTKNEVQSVVKLEKQIRNYSEKIKIKETLRTLDLIENKPEINQLFTNKFSVTKLNQISEVLENINLVKNNQNLQQIIKISSESNKNIFSNVNNIKQTLQTLNLIESNSKINNFITNKVSVSKLNQVSEILQNINLISSNKKIQEIKKFNIQSKKININDIKETFQTINLIENKSEINQLFTNKISYTKLNQISEVLQNINLLKNNKNLNYVTKLSFESNKKNISNVYNELNVTSIEKNERKTEKSFTSINKQIDRLYRMNERVESKAARAEQSFYDLINFSDYSVTKKTSTKKEIKNFFQTLNQVKITNEQVKQRIKPSVKVNEYRITQSSEKVKIDIHKQKTDNYYKVENVNRFYKKSYYEEKQEKEAQEKVIESKVEELLVRKIQHVTNNITNNVITKQEINNIKQEIIREIFKVEEKYEKKIQAIKQETQQTVQSMLNQFLKS